MDVLTPLALIAGLTFSLAIVVWGGARLLRWARRGSKGAALLGMGLIAFQPR